MNKAVKHIMLAVSIAPRCRTWLFAPCDRLSHFGFEISNLILWILTPDRIATLVWRFHAIRRSEPLRYLVGTSGKITTTVFQRLRSTRHFGNLVRLQSIAKVASCILFSAVICRCLSCRLQMVHFPAAGLREACTSRKSLAPRDEMGNSWKNENNREQNEQI